MMKLVHYLTKVLCTRAHRHLLPIFHQQRSEKSGKKSYFQIWLMAKDYVFMAASQAVSQVGISVTSLGMYL